MVLLLPCFAGLLAGPRRRRTWMLALVIICSGGAAWLSGCGNGDHQAPAGNYTIPVNLTSTSAASQAINIMVTVQ
jgi:hypothetical protein